MTDEAAIRIDNVVRRFGAQSVLDHVSLVIRRGEFFALLGPSGCGKTTLLRILGGLDLPDEGSVTICGRDAHSFSPEERPVNTVFQSYALFPHLSVRDNIAFGLRMKGVAPGEITGRVDKVMDATQITSLADRKPAQLSGGQKQRVAVARAIVNEPKVLLLDEPLGALDLKLRRELQVELLTLQRRLGITFVFVTHDQEEALVLSDRIAVMRAGRIEQLGEAEDLYERPRTRFVANFLGSCNVFECSGAKPAGAASVLASTPLGEIRVEVARPVDSGALRVPALALRPEKIQMSADLATRGENWFRARVEQLVYNGAETQYLLKASGHSFKAEALNTRVGSQGFDVGQEIAVFLPPAALIVLEET